MSVLIGALAGRKAVNPKEKWKRRRCKRSSTTHAGSDWLPEYVTNSNVTLLIIEKLIGTHGVHGSHGTHICDTVLDHDATTRPLVTNTNMRAKTRRMEAISG
eukprot:139666-Amorphochlora_amoeboformis.AAC.2